MNRLTAGLLALAMTGGAMAAGKNVPLDQAQTDIGNVASLQRGAATYMNYCAGCHSMEYMRYSRLMEDLELSEEQVVENLIFDNNKKIGDLMTISMAEGDATEWLGAAPPDLSVVARSKGVDWIYSMLKAYYPDPSRPTGWNNVVFENSSMPNVLWNLQGIQALAPHGEGEEEAGHAGLPEFEVLQAGSMTAEEFDELVTDLTAFIQYAGEPAALQRTSLGVWVLLYLALFTFMAWLVKKEYWRDIKGH